MIGAVLGRSGQTINMIENVTGAKLHLSQPSGEGDEMQRTLTITGKPSSVYAGHMLAMSRVLLQIRESQIHNAQQGTFILTN